MKYVLEDTIDGYRISLQRDDGSVVHSVHEKGGHGPVETAYKHAEEAYSRARGLEACPDISDL